MNFFVVFKRISVQRFERVFSNRKKFFFTFSFSLFGWRRVFRSTFHLLFDMEKAFVRVVVLVQFFRLVFPKFEDIIKHALGIFLWQPHYLFYCKFLFRKRVFLGLEEVHFGQIKQTQIIVLFFRDQVKRTLDKNIRRFEVNQFLYQGRFTYKKRAFFYSLKGNFFRFS